jgi:lysophospholipase L1-like esterase
MAPRSGYGNALCERLQQVACLNLARGGRSTKSYRAEGLWDTVLALLNEQGGPQKNLVLLQFGHNDQPGKPGRSTDLATEFPANLRRYVQEIRAAGAHPVLLTPLTRRAFKDGRLLDGLEPWADVIRGIAKDMQVPLVDLHARSVAAVQALGPAQSMRFAQAPAWSWIYAAAQTGTTVDHDAPALPGMSPNPTGRPALGQPKRQFDYTHLGPEGADFFAAIVADELSRAVPELRERLYP